MPILQRILTFVKFSGENSTRVTDMKILQPLNSQNMHRRYVTMVTEHRDIGIFFQNEWS